MMLVLVVVVLLAAQKRFENTKREDFWDHLEDTVVTINGEDITFKDLSFYVLYEERVVEEKARIYNPKSSKDFWNIHTNYTFVQGEAKDVILEMAIHDRLFYQLAMEEGLTLSAEDEKYLASATEDFWEDLFDEQLERLPATKNEINEQIRILCLAEKYQNLLAETDGPSVAAYKYDGYYYGQMLEDYDVEVNSKLWDRIVVGDITLVHGPTNYVNGYNEE